MPNLPVNAIVRLLHLRSGDSQGQETFLAPSTDKQICKSDRECSNHHPSLSTLSSKGFSHSKMKWSAIYKNLPANAIVRLPQVWKFGKFRETIHHYRVCTPCGNDETNFRFP